MSLCSPYIWVECDECGEVSDDLIMTLLAGGSWDDRGVPGQLKRMGWTIEGDRHLCPECSEAQP